MTAASLETYNETDPWNTFKEIVALTDEELTAIKNIENEQGEKDNKTDVIYDLNGRRLSNERLKMNNERLPKGVYIVRSTQSGASRLKNDKKVLVRK